jgi:hypothetical protein
MPCDVDLPLSGALPFEQPPQPELATQIGYFHRLPFHPPFDEVRGREKGFNALYWSRRQPGLEGPSICIQLAV